MKLLLMALLLFQQEDPSKLQAIFDTSAGTFTLEFYATEAPNHVKKFIDLARQGFYNGTTFHSMVSHGIEVEGLPCGHRRTT
jgi:cyclophilin family peptidyl-prolyl cis-trans isomerase